MRHSDDRRDRWNVTVTVDRSIEGGGRVIEDCGGGSGEGAWRIDGDGRVVEVSVKDLVPERGGETLTGRTKGREWSHWEAASSGQGT